MSNTVICGIDEAGRGPLAGPVSAAAVHLAFSPSLHPKGGWFVEESGQQFRLFDSKELDAEEREQSYQWITTHCPFGVAMRSAEEIDRIGILEATNAAMQEAVAMLAERITPTYLLVDGRDAFWFNYPHSSVIRGDALEPAIAAASIIAKVTRDRFMIEAHREFPQYAFNLHKGYAAPQHIEAIQVYGPCALHRLTYLRNLLPMSSTPTTQSPKSELSAIVPLSKIQ